MKRTLKITTVIALIVLTIACGGGVSSNNPGSSGSVIFVTGEDAPLPTIVSFFITLNAVKLNNSSGSVTVLSTPTTVDLGRLVGYWGSIRFNQGPTRVQRSPCPIP